MADLLRTAHNWTAHAGAPIIIMNTGGSNGTHWRRYWVIWKLPWRPVRPFVGIKDQKYYQDGNSCMLIPPFMFGTEASLFTWIAIYAANTWAREEYPQTISAQEVGIPYSAGPTFYLVESRKN